MWLLLSPHIREGPLYFASIIVHKKEAGPLYIASIILYIWERGPLCIAGVILYEFDTVFVCSFEAASPSSTAAAAASVAAAASPEAAALHSEQDKVFNQIFNSIQMGGDQPEAQAQLEEMMKALMTDEPQMAEHFKNLSEAVEAAGGDICLTAWWY